VYSAEHQYRMEQGLPHIDRDVNILINHRQQVLQYEALMQETPSVYTAASGEVVLKCGHLFRVLPTGRWEVGFDHGYFAWNRNSHYCTRPVFFNRYIDVRLITVSS
jgi:hypothetical protein